MLCIMCSIFCLICLAVSLFVILMNSKTRIPSRFASKFAHFFNLTVHIQTDINYLRFNINMLINGDGETGPCEIGGNITIIIRCFFFKHLRLPGQSRTLWKSLFVELRMYFSDRGNCYFAGQRSAQTAMWQNIDLNNYVDPFLIDSQTVRFNLSAWIGGWGNQNDAAIVSLDFYDHFNQRIANRAGQTSLLFRQTSGLIPGGTRIVLSY